MQATTKLLGALLLSFGLGFAQTAAADAVSSPPAPLQASTAGAGEVLSAADLEALSGGTGVEPEVLTNQTLTAVNSGNSVSGQTVTSGQINLSDGALASFNGVGNFVMNTGHNNNLQSSMSVTVVLPPTP